MSTTSLHCFYKKYKKIFFYSLTVIGLFFIFGESTFAEADPVISAEDSEKIVSILNGIITAGAAIMGMVTAFITMFLYPGWVNGTLFGLQDYLKIIWVMVSNVVYFVFAFILIAIAFMNIIGKGEGTWELKQAMPKFIVGVLIVPFSWFFIQFILSISSILTVGFLTLPYESFKSEDLLAEAVTDTELGAQEICKDVIITLTGDTPEGATAFTSADGETLGETLWCKDGGFVSVQEIFEGTGGGEGLQDSVFGIISVYTYGILRVQELDTISGTDLESIKKIADLIFKIFFDLLFIVVYMLLMVALFLALFVRGVRLWLYMMLSPAFGLLYFFGKSSEGVGGDNSKFSIKEFIALALVPVYVSAALAFGLVFILVASKGIQQEAMEGDTDTISVGGFSLAIIGAHGSGETEASPIAKLIVEIFGVVILWIAVMAALKQSETTKAIVEPIAKFGSDVGALAAKAPTYAPIIPTGAGGMQSAQSLKTIGGQISSAAATRETRRAQSFMDGYGGDNTGNPGVTKLNTEAEIAADKIRRFGESGDNRRVIKELRDALRENGGTTENIKSSTGAKAAIIAAASALEIDEISGRKVEDMLSTPSDITQVLANIDRAAEDKGVRDGETLFDKRHAVIAPADYNKWVETGSLSGVVAGDTVNNFDFKINGTDISTENEAINAYVANQSIYATGAEVESDLRDKGITDDAVVARVVKAYEDAVNEDG